jgi:hypothetical protein
MRRGANWFLRVERQRRATAASEASAFAAPFRGDASGGRLASNAGRTMSFAGTNYLAIVLAAVIGWLAGAVWYKALGKTWMAALGTTREEMEQAKRRPGALLPFIYAFVAELIMAWVLAGLLGHIGALTLRGGVISAAFCWLGFVLTTMLVNNSFARRDWRLLLIDGGHWLIVLLLMGAIIGAMGVR